MCKSCGKPLITTVSVSRCVFCGRKKGIFQQSDVMWTRRGAQRKAQRVVASHALASAEMTWQEAEVVCCEWMKGNGYRDARLTGTGADGGVDITSRKAIAQVKHHATAVGLAEIQRLYGIATASGKKALFFSCSGYTKAAIAWARTHGVECFRYPPVAQVGR